MIKKSFTIRVLILSFFLIALPLLVSSFIFFQELYDKEIEGAKQELNIVTNLRSFSMRASQPVQEILLKEVSYLLDLNTRLDKTISQKDHTEEIELNAELIKIAHRDTGSHILILSIESDFLYQVIASSSHAMLNSYIESYELIKNVLKTGSGSFVRYVYSENAQKFLPYLFVAHVIPSKRGDPVGIIMTMNNIENQLNEIFEKKTMLSGVQFAILNQDEIVFAATDKNIEGAHFYPISQSRKKEIIDSGQLGSIKITQKPLNIVDKGKQPFFEFIYQGKTQIAYRNNIPDLNIAIIGYLEKKEFFESALRRFFFIYALFIVVLVIGGGITYWLSLWISRPLRQLMEQMNQVSQGNLDVRFKEEPFGFEINILGKIFNQTIDTLLAHIQNAENERVQKQTYERELLLGHQVQQSLLPHEIPSIHGAQIASAYLPGKIVGGDIYNYSIKKSREGKEQLILSMIDIDGKGIPASLYSLSVNSLFRSYTRLSDDIAEIMQHVNEDFIKDVGDGQPIVIKNFSGIYDSTSKILSYICCGEIFGLVKRNGDDILALKPTNFPLGSSLQERFIAEKLQLNAGDLLVLYTSALLKDKNFSKNHDAEKIIHFILEEQEYATAQKLIDRMVRDVAILSQDEEMIIVALKTHLTQK